MTAQTSDEEVRVLMRAAYRLIGQIPDRPVTLQELLDESRLSTRAFYRHFATKDELLVAMYRTDGMRVAAELSARMASCRSAHDALTAWVDHWISITFEVRRSLRLRVLASSQFDAADGMRAAVQENDDSSVACLATVLEDGLRSGDFPRTAPLVDAPALHAVAVSLIRARLGGDLVASPEDARAHLLDFAHRLLGESPHSRSKR